MARAEAVGKLILRLAVGLLILLRGIAKLRHGLGFSAPAAWTSGGEGAVELIARTSILPPMPYLQSTCSFPYPTMETFQ